MLAEPEPKGVERYRGVDVVSSEGKKVGSAEEFFYHRLSGVAQWIAVSTGAFSGRTLVVPVAGASFEDNEIRVPYTKQVIQDEPEIELDGGMLSEAEAMLSAYFGLGTEDSALEGRL